MNCMQIELTNRCNFQCEFCATKLTRNNYDMPIEKVYDLLDQGKDLDIFGGKVWQISFNGLGEPLLHKNLNEAVAYAKKRYPFVGFITNGYLLDEERSKALLDLDLDYLGVSITGINVDIYKDFQGYGFKDLKTSEQVMERVKGNIKRYLEMRDKMGKNTQVRIEYILTEGTKRHVKDFVDYWKKTNHEAMIDLTPLTTWEKKDNMKYTRCERLGNDFMIFANGDVSICSCDHLRGTGLGNVFEKPLKNIICCDEFASILKANDELALVHMPKVCLKCDRLINFGFLKNHTDVYRTVYVNNTATNIKWWIYSNGARVFDELKKNKITYPLWRKTKNWVRKRETAQRKKIN